jgi:hypothetical protein
LSSEQKQTKLVFKRSIDRLNISYTPRQNGRSAHGCGNGWSVYGCLSPGDCGGVLPAHVLGGVGHLLRCRRRRSRREGGIGVGARQPTPPPLHARTAAAVPPQPSCGPPGAAATALSSSAVAKFRRYADWCALWCAATRSSAAALLSAAMTPGRLVAALRLERRH